MNGSRIRLSGPITFSAPVGEVCAVTSVAVPGSPPHIVASFRGVEGSSVRLELDPATVMELARQFPECLASLKKFPDCAGSAWGGETE